MAQILVPANSPEDWKPLLARPNLHWKEGYSAMTLARSWQAAAPTGFPPEVARILATAERSDWTDLRLLIAMPEYAVPLPGGVTASQTDIVALARSATGLVAIAVEGKVDESLGPTVGEKRSEATAGVRTRIDYLEKTLGITARCPDSIRYQLLHRTVSALRVAEDFGAGSAVMLVHSFSPTGKWQSDFQAFVALFGVVPEAGTLADLGTKNGIDLYLGWCPGDSRHRMSTANSDA